MFLSRTAGRKEYDRRVRTKTRAGAYPDAKTLAPAGDGQDYGIVERFNAHVGEFGIRQDLFGFIDIILSTQPRHRSCSSCGQDFSGHIKLLEERKKPCTVVETRQGRTLGWRKVKLQEAAKPCDGWRG